MKTHTYMFQNFYDDCQRYIVVGACDMIHAADLFCSRYGLTLDYIKVEKGMVYTTFDKWLVKLLLR